jgi:hypothetical protein
MNKKDPKTIQWRTTFVQLGGTQHLLHTFINLNIVSIENSLTLKCIEKLLMILFEFVGIDKSIIGEIISK